MDADMITEHIFQQLEDFIQSKIENEIERWHGRDAINETIREMDCRRELREAFGLPPNAP